MKIWRAVVKPMTIGISISDNYSKQMEMWEFLLQISYIVVS